jgi:hypothetical protein
MFEARQSAERRDMEYETLGPFMHEREVGINCGQLATEGGEEDRGTRSLTKALRLMERVGPFFRGIKMIFPR